MKRTYSREEWFRAKEAWEDFGWQWQAIRRLAADRGFIFPPKGSRHDDRDSVNPSPRAIIWRALEDNPRELQKIVARSNSWSEVVGGIIGLEHRLREDADDLDRDNAYDKALRPTPRGALIHLGDFMRKISDSL